MKKSAFLSDLIFTFLATLVPFLCLLRHLAFPFALAILFACAFAALATVAAFLILQKKRKRLVVEQKEARERDDLVLYLSLLSDSALGRFFKDYLQTETCVPTIRKTGGILAVETEDTAFYPTFTVKPVDGDRIAKIVKAKTDKRKVLLCPATAPEAETLAFRFFIDIQRADEIYKNAKAKKLLPEKYPFGQEPSSKWKNKARIWFSKKNARPFFVSALLLFLSSLLTPFGAYYLVFGFLLLILAVFTRILGTR